MRHLKSFKIFESSSEDLLGIIHDIFESYMKDGISLDDSNMKYEIKNLEKIGLIHIKITGHNEEIDDCVNHLSNYLKDLGHLYFIGRKINNPLKLTVTHISIENKFKGAMGSDFRDIINGIREVSHGEYPNFRFWLRPDNYCLFKKDKKTGELFYDYTEIYEFFENKYSLKELEIDELVRYLLGKHLKLESFYLDGQYPFYTQVGRYFSSSYW